MKCEFKTGTDGCNIYAWTCDYDNYCSSNNDCPMKKLIQKLEKIEELADIMINTNCNYILEAQNILKIIRGEE